ncbi:MAG TPA: serine hydrolase [Pseudomonadota bacterium]|nr:serine hydrolase [Rhodanobacteraceae bacterium]MBP9154053.1 serine hydrolase [Xanthomonadales bacterium]HQW81154.1 serine hydrolase [Pseudomonadota bacterium]
MRYLLALLAMAWLSSATAGRLYGDSFEVQVLKPLFAPATVGGPYQLPAGPAVDQLNWLLMKIQSGAALTQGEYDAHFDISYGYPFVDTANFIAAIQASYPNAVVTDVIAITPVVLTVLIDTPNTGAPYGFLTLRAHYTGGKKILSLGVSGYSSVQYADDHARNLAQSVTQFSTLSTSPALLVARIGSNNQCTPVVQTNAASLRATASIFKLWIMGAVARAVTNGTITIDQMVPMVAEKLALAGTINSEPVGTPFPVSDLSELMIGISDNTATDLLHGLVGRSLIDQVVTDFGVAQPLVLTPLLGISEQFSLYLSFPLSTAMSYVNGTEVFQENFLQTQIAPLLPVTGGPYANTSVLTAGTWRATPMDICAAFAHLRHLPQGTDAMDLVNHAMGAGVAQPDVRNHWDRVWYKGGSLSSGAGYHVLTHAWMLEDTGQDPYVVVAMSNSDAGGIDQYRVQSIAGRILELVRTTTP